MGQLDTIIIMDAIQLLFLFNILVLVLVNHLRKK